jgi:ribosomal-protein-alanine N-acetyltransferase
MLDTARLRLIPANAPIARAELFDRPAFAAAIGAGVPDNWPPETLADALPQFLELIEQEPDWRGWLTWYAIAVDGAEPILVGSGGFTGPPGSEGVTETGYSILPQFQGRGYATEMVTALLAWARRQGARAVVAQTTDDNAGSRNVLAKLGFVAAGPAKEPDHTFYRLAFDEGARV